MRLYRKSSRAGNHLPGTTIQMALAEAMMTVGIKAEDTAAEVEVEVVSEEAAVVEEITEVVAAATEEEADGDQSSIQLEFTYRSVALAGWKLLCSSRCKKPLTQYLAIDFRSTSSSFQVLLLHYASLLDTLIR